MHRKLPNDFSKRDLTRRWDSPHQTRETLSHKREAAGTALCSFRGTSCAPHGQNTSPGCSGALQRAHKWLHLWGWRKPLQTDSLLKVTRIYSVSQKPRISRASWHGTFQSLGWHSLSEVSACPNTVRYWLSSGAAGCPPSAAPETRWRMPMSPLQMQALRKAPSHRQRGHTAAA